MERLTFASLPRRAWLVQLALLVLLLLGPERVAWIISAVAGIVTWPLSQELEVGGGPYEVANLELLMVYVIAVMGMNLFFQTGLFSLGHTAFFALGAYTTAILSVEHGVSFWLALAAAAALSGIAGAVLALPAARLGAFTFAMITLGYAIITSDLILELDSLTGGGEGILGVEAPAPFDDPSGYYWLLAGLSAVGFVLARNLLRSPYGRQAKATAGTAVGAQSLGIDPGRTKVRAFTVSAVYAGVAGALFGPVQGLLSPSSFSTDLAILLLLMVLLGGAGTVAGPIVGAVLLFQIPLEVEEITDKSGDVSLLVYGLVLIASVYLVPQGLMSAWWRIRRRHARGSASVEAPIRTTSTAGDEADATRANELGQRVLTVTDVSVALGGVRALDGVALDASSYQIHALIGPNGSGKTTFLNIVSGYLRPDSGRVDVAGRDATGLAPHTRVALGLGRTFQTPNVFEGMSCVENVMVALDHSRRDRFAGAALRLPGAVLAERERYRRGHELLESAGLADRAGDDARELPPGERRMLELARVLALEPRLVLLDEPAGGLNEVEIGRLETFVRGLRDRGVAILLVEHNVDLVMRLADHVTVLNFGRVISAGEPGQVRRDPEVIAGYLGDEPLESAGGLSARSGGR